LSSQLVTGQFTSFTEWVNKARSWIGGTGAVCTDTKWRVLRCGADFMRARDEGTFPVTYTFDPEKRQRPRTRRERALRELGENETFRRRLAGGAA